jgi:hypothetical protein
MARVMNDQTGYYSIGYKPSASASKGARGEPRFRQIAVRVTRPGLTARFHSSLYVEEQAQPTPASGNQRLAAAVSSPFAIPNVRIRISTTSGTRERPPAPFSTRSCRWMRAI